MHATEGRGAAQERRQTIGRVRTRRTAASSARSNARQCGMSGRSSGPGIEPLPEGHTQLDPSGAVVCPTLDERTDSGKIYVVLGV